VRIFLTELGVLAVLVFLTEIVIAVLLFLTARVLPVVLFHTELDFYCTACSY
jgi:hypothetical protein